MEAIAGLSLACNIIQVVGTALEAANVVYQVYNDGHTAENSAMANRSANLRAMTLELDTILQGVGNKSLSSVDERLKSVAQECCEISMNLDRELHQLRPTGGRRDSLFKGIRTWRKKGDIGKLKLRLLDIERTMNTGLLVTLKQQVNALAATSSLNIDSLDQKTRLFIQSLASGITQCSDLVQREGLITRTLIDVRNDQLLGHIDTQFTDLHSTAESKARRTQLLASLYFPEMNARMNQIEQSETTTFEWLFEDPAPVSMTNFPTWLSAGQELYWIQGKAGSGKSTLMKFIMEHVRTRELLSTWSGDRATTILNAGLWLSGSPLQRSTHGLLCSLLHQLLSVDSTITSRLLSQTPYLTERLSVNDWGRAELRRSFELAIQCRAKTNPICIFLDGLDELDQKEDPDVLFNMISALKSFDNVKLVVSSRPEAFWVRKMEKTPGLRLQDLTRQDITSFIRNKLEPYMHRSATETYKQDNVQTLIESIVTKANGVFLWVRIAVSSLTRGLAADADTTELYRRLDHLPSDLESLYGNMLSRSGDDWNAIKQEAGLYFHLCLASDMVTSFQPNGLQMSQSRLFHAMVCDYYRQHDWSDDPPHLTQDEFLAACKRTKDRIEYVCLGMVELEHSTSDIEDTERCFAMLTLSHRTVRDFLLDKLEGQAILATINVTENDIIHWTLIANLLCHELDIIPWTWWKAKILMSDICLWSRRYIDGHPFVQVLRLADESLYNKFSAEQETTLSTPYRSFPPHEEVAEILHKTWKCQFSMRQKDLDTPDLDPMLWRHTDGPKDSHVPHQVFDLLGLSLSMGVPFYFEHIFYSTHASCSLSKLSSLYKGYLLYCVIDGLERITHAVTRFSRSKIKCYDDERARFRCRAMVVIAQKLRDSDIDINIFERVDTLTVLRLGDTIVHAHVSSSSPLNASDQASTSHYVTDGSRLKNYHRIKPDFWSEGIFVAVAFDPYAYVDFQLLWHSRRLSELREVADRSIEFPGTPWLLVRHASSVQNIIPGIMIQEDDSRELQRLLNTWFQTPGCLKSPEESTAIDMELHAEFDRTIDKCVSSVGDAEWLDTSEVLLRRGFIKEPEGFLWEQQHMPIFK